MPPWFRIAAALLILTGVGCGGRLKYTIQDALLADVPIAEKQSLLGVRDEQALLKQSRSKAWSEQAIAERDLKVADAEYRIAKQQIDKVQADLALAKTTKDVNRINRAQARLDVAELGRNTADTKVAWRKLRLSYAQQQVRVLDLQAQHVEARYEQEKARLAAAKGKTPYKGFSLSQFDLQVSESQARWDKERVESDRLKQEILQVEGRYQALQQQLSLARSESPSQAVPPAPPLSASPPSR